MYPDNSKAGLAAKHLCPDLVKFFINFENKRHFILVPSPPVKVIFNLRFYFKKSHKVQAQI